MNCRDADDGQSDFIAGKRDEARYNDAVKGGDYRRGWQLARLGQIADAPKPPPQPFPAPTLSDDAPWDDAPVVRRETAQGQPAAVVVASVPEPRTEQKSPTREDVRLAAGEDKPKKSKPALAGQLDLFG